MAEMRQHGRESSLFPPIAMRNLIPEDDNAQEEMTLDPVSKVMTL
jgi:hypothetical protein